MATDRSWDEPPAAKRSRVEDTAQHQPQLDDLLKDVPPALLNKKCSEKFLGKVAQSLTTWWLLRPHLELSRVDEENIERNKRTNEEQKLDLLLRWHDKFGKRATVRFLVRAIFNMGNVDLAHKVCQMVKKSSVEVAHTPSSSLMDTSTPPPATAAPSTTSSSASSLAVTMSPATATAAPSPAMLSYRDQLRRGYKTHKPVMVMEWPPPPALKYISLAMIKKEAVERGNITDEYIRTTIHGNMDDILHEKVPVEVDQLFSLDSDEREVILVEGAPGSGKSTLLWHICQRWQSGELFQQFTLVLLVLLRDTAVHTAQCLADILPCVPSRSSKYTPSEYRKAIASDIEDRHGEGVLIMLDGWDEAPDELRQKNSLIHDIIAEPGKCSVEAAAVVVSSRPSASHDIRKYASTRVEVLGFKRERREEYVRESLLDPESAKLLLQRIESVPQLGENCHLPLNLVIITHTFICSGNTLPSTYCRIIITLALSCLLRHIQKSTTLQSLESFSDLPDGIREEFLKLCKLAYKGVAEEKYSFTSEDLRELTQLSATGAPQVTTLGLLQAVHSLVATGSSTVYHFLHLSLQELCAAYYIASLPSPETEHVKALSNTENVRAHFQPVCEFYSALTHLGNRQVVSQLLDIYRMGSARDVHPTIELSLENVSFFKCLAEADNPAVTAEIIGTRVKIQSSVQALASAIQQASHLKSVSCDVFSSAISQALSGKTSLKQLEINISSSIDMEHVKHVLTTCKNLEHFTMSGKFGDTEVSHLAEVLNQTSIQTLDLSSTLQETYLSGGGTGEDGIIALSSALKTNTTIQHLTVSCKNVGPRGQEAFAEALSQNTSLNTLEVKAIDHPGPFTEDDRAFFGCLKVSPSLINFSMQRIRVPPGISSFCPWKSVLSPSDFLRDTYVGRTLLSGDLVELADILKLNRPPAVDKQIRIDLYSGASMEVDFKSMCFTYLKVSDCRREKQSQCKIEKLLNERPTNIAIVDLDLSKHKIGNTGAKHLANVMFLQKLNIGNCGIEEDGMVALSSGLSTSTTLKCLWVNSNTFGDKGATHLAKALSSTPLEEIDISYCGIGDDGMVAIFSALSTNTTLKHLDISGNKCRDEGIIALSSALSTNTTLKYLNARGNNFGDKGASHLAMALSHMPLQKIDISDCGIGDDGMEALSSALSVNTTLKCLIAYGNKFGDEGASHLAKALCHTSLQEIYISCCGVGEDGMVALFSALGTNTTLERLNISGNKSKDEGIIALSSALSTNTTLKHLEVPLDISGHSRLALARSLLQNTTLTSLSLNGSRKELCHDENLCNDEDLYCFGCIEKKVDLGFLKDVFTHEVIQELLKEASTFYTNIKKSPMIRYISIEATTTLGEALWSGNMKEAEEILELNLPPAVKKTLKIRMSNNTWVVNYGARTVFATDVGLLKVHSIYNVPTSWDSLHELTLKNMYLGSVGACLLAEMLNETQIQKLDVSGCHIPEDGIVALSLVLGTNTTLKYLAIGANCINERGQKALARALVRNTTLAVLDIREFDMNRIMPMIPYCYKSFKDNGDIFCQSLKQFSLSTLIYDYYDTSGEVFYTIDYILDLKTFTRTSHGHGDLIIDSDEEDSDSVF